MLSYFILEKKGKVEDATIFVLTSLALSAVINYYDISSFYINENSFLNILVGIFYSHFLIGFTMMFSHALLTISYKYIFDRFDFKLLEQYKQLLKDDKINKFNKVNGHFDYNDYNKISEEAISHLAKKISLATHAIITFLFFIMIILKYLYKE